MDENKANHNREALEQAISEAFADMDMNKRLIEHAELVDVNNRFRKISVCGKNYIAKKTTSELAQKERENSIAISNKMGVLKYDGIAIEVVVPELYNVGREIFLVSPYIGMTIAGEYSEKGYSLFPKHVMFFILKWFYDEGIVYRGFLPRNTFYPDPQHCFLIDFEEITIKNKNECSLNRQWETNFLLNWGYIYRMDDIRAFFQSLQDEKYWNEPETNRYEKIWNGLLVSTGETTINRLREAIERIVLFAERPYCKNVKGVIQPNDCAHLVSDLLGGEIDVFFDIALYILEEKRIEWIGFIGETIRIGMNEQCIKKEDIMLIIVEMFCDSKCNTIERARREQNYNDRINTFIQDIAMNAKSNIVLAYINGERAVLTERLTQYMLEVLERIFTEQRIDGYFFSKDGVLDIVKEISERSNKFVKERRKDVV